MANVANVVPLVPVPQNANDEHRTKIPTMTWSQKNQNIFLTIKLQDCFDHKLNVKSDSIHFTGVSGGEKYEFKTEFFGTVDPNKKICTVGGQSIKISLTLADDESGSGKICKWPRFTKNLIKIPTLKVDMVNMDSEDSSEEEKKRVKQGALENFEETMLEGLGTEIPKVEESSSSESEEQRRDPDCDSDGEVRVHVKRGARGRGGFRGRGRGDGRGQNPRGRGGANQSNPET